MASFYSSCTYLTVLVVVGEGLAKDAHNFPGTITELSDCKIIFKEFHHMLINNNNYQESAQVQWNFMSTY